MNETYTAKGVNQPDSDVVAPAGAPSLGEPFGGAPASFASEASRGQATPMRETGPTGPASSATPPVQGNRTPGTKPLRAIQLVNGRCACTQCRADEAREQERRDAALIAAVYDLGVEQLRTAALERVPAFLDAFERAS